MVTVRVFGQTLLPCVEESEMQCEVTEPLKVSELLEANPEQFGGLMDFLNKSELMITVNQKIVTKDAIVKDGDLIKLTHQFNPNHDGALWHNP